MFRSTRRTALAVFAAISLAACGSAGGDNTDTPDLGSSNSTTVQDIIVGDANAPITMVEYASWTCSHCLQFHNDVMPMIRRDYIETGKVRFVFREFPTAPANIAIAGFAIGRCAGPDKYLDVLDELFERQPGILSMVSQGGQVRAALKQVAENHGISGDEAFDACLQDTEIRRTIATAVGRGDAAGVNATPTVFINGVKLDGYEWRYEDGMREVLDEALGEITPPVATEAPAEDAAPTESASE